MEFASRLMGESRRPRKFTTNYFCVNNIIDTDTMADYKRYLAAGILTENKVVGRLLPELIPLTPLTEN